MSDEERKRRRTYSGLGWAFRVFLMDYKRTPEATPVKFTNGSAIMRTHAGGRL